MPSPAGSTATATAAPHRVLTAADWRALAANPDFLALKAARRRFTVPAVIFFIGYYFSLPILVGYVPDLMHRRIAGSSINVAYLFALSQFFMAWAILALYVRRARAFDAMAARIVADATTPTLTPAAGRR